MICTEFIIEILNLQLCAFLYYASTAAVAATLTRYYRRGPPDRLIVKTIANKWHGPSINYLHGDRNNRVSFRKQKSGAFKFICFVWTVNHSVGGTERVTEAPADGYLFDLFVQHLIDVSAVHRSNRLQNIDEFIFPDTDTYIHTLCVINSCM